MPKKVYNYFQTTLAHCTDAGQWFSMFLHSRPSLRVVMTSYLFFRRFCAKYVVLFLQTLNPQNPWFIAISRVFHQLPLLLLTNALIPLLALIAHNKHMKNITQKNMKEQRDQENPLRGKSIKLYHSPNINLVYK